MTVLFRTPSRTLNAWMAISQGPVLRSVKTIGIPTRRRKSLSATAVPYFAMVGHIEGRVQPILVSYGSLRQTSHMFALLNSGLCNPRVSRGG